MRREVYDDYVPSLASEKGAGRKSLGTGCGIWIAGRAVAVGMGCGLDVALC